MDSTVLVHIGYHKTATTWMQTYLFNDTDIGFAAPLENVDLDKIIVLPHPFDFDTEKVRSQMDAAVEQARKQNRVPVISSERFSGSLYGGGYDSQTIANRLADLFPNARVLIVIREQKNVIRSTYSQYIRSGGILRLEDFLRAHPPNLVSQFQFEHFMYHRLIRYYYQLFGQDRVLVLPFELFVAHPDQFVERIVNACGLAIPPEAAITKMYGVHVNNSFTASKIIHVRRIHYWFGNRSVLNMSSVLPLNKYQVSTIRGMSWTVLRHLIPRPYNQRLEQKLRERVAHIVGERYQASNAETARLTGLDLQTYGYDLPVSEVSTSNA